MEDWDKLKRMEKIERLRAKEAKIVDTKEELKEIAARKSESWKVWRKRKMDPEEKGQEAEDPLENSFNHPQRSAPESEYQAKMRICWKVKIREKDKNMPNGWKNRRKREVRN